MSSVSNSGVTQITVEPGKAWGWVLASGILSTLLGIVILVSSTSQRVWLLAVWVGVSFLLVGLQRLALAAVAEENRGLAVASGLLSVAAALVIFFWPDETLWVLAIFAGAAALAGGVLDVLMGLRGGTRDKTSAIVRGVIGIVVGVAILVWPEATISVIALLLGAFLLLQGIFMTISAFALRRMASDLQGTYGVRGAVVTVSDDGLSGPEVTIEPLESEAKSQGDDAGSPPPPIS